MQGYKKSNPQASYIKAGVLFAILVVLFIISDRLAKGKMPSMNLAKMQSGLARMNQMQLYDDAKKDSVRKAITGLWITAPGDMALTSAINMEDRIEIKDNGIFWQVKNYRVILPAGDTTRFTHIMTGYLMPFGQRLTGDSTAFSDIRVIYQVMIQNQDTCYGESDITIGWPHSARPKPDSSLMIDDARHVAYKGEIAQFFPEGATKLVKKISLGACAAEYSFYSVLRKQVTDEYAGIQKNARDSSEVRSIIENYYSVILRQAVGAEFSIGDIEKTPEVRISFSVNPEGNVIDAKVMKKAPGVNSLERFVATNAGLWKFPPAKGSHIVKMVYEHHQ
jgi:hypothetical protein